jgi:hypothetical protein
MLLDVLSDGNSDCQRLRLYRFNNDEAGKLHDAVVELSTGRIQEIVVHRLPYVEAIAGCQLTLCANSFDHGILHLDASRFECRFTVETWDNVAGLIEPFAEGAAGYQWLAGSPDHAALLLSFTGDW